MLIDIMGFGQPAEAGINPDRLESTAGHFTQSMNVVADALGMAFDRVETSGDVGLARAPIPLTCGRVIEPGQIATQCITVSGISNGRALIRMQLLWYCSADTE